MLVTKVLITLSECNSIERDFPVWEVPLLTQIHGEGKVAPGIQHIVDREYPNAADEYQRFVQRYKDDVEAGQDHVALVYGQGPLGIQRLQDAIDAAKKAEVKVAKKASAESLTQ